MADLPGVLAGGDVGVVRSGNHTQGCVLRDDDHDEPCLTALPPWWDADCKACARIYCEPRYSCEDVCVERCIGACGG